MSRSRTFPSPAAAAIRGLLAFVCLATTLAAQSGIKVTDEELAAVQIEKATFHGEWNYTIDQDAKADNVDWKQWAGPVKHQDTKNFDADHYFRWRKFYPYCAGLRAMIMAARISGT